jgi:CMP/dCMP kinase
MEKHTMTITVSRQMGSGGTYIGRQVAKELGFSYIDREVLRQAAALLKEDETSLEAYEERSLGFAERFLRVFSAGSPENPYVPKEPPIYDNNLFIVEGRIIRDMASRDNAVIMGRGGFALLKGRPNTLHLFVHGPRIFRVDQVIKAEGITDRREALARVEESDMQRARFIKDMVGTEWTDARNYHLCVDASVSGLSESASMIANFARKVLF